MKKQLFALALTTLLVGCVRSNQQIKVADYEFYAKTQPEVLIERPQTAVVTQVVKCKTTNFEEIGKEPDNFEHKAVYHLTFNPTGIESTPEYLSEVQPFAITSELARDCQDAYGFEFYINPFRMVINQVIPIIVSSDIVEVRFKTLDYTFNNKYWLTKGVITETTKYAQEGTKISALKVLTETLTIKYEF